MSRGFTLVELLVAVALTSLMIFLINQIFNDTFNAVSRGVQTGDIIANHRAFTDQIQRDANEMVVPNSLINPGPGFLAILTKRVDRAAAGVPMPDPSGRVGDITVPFLRSDQLVFIRVADSANDQLEQITPAGTITFTGASNARAAYARVWYGHLDQTQEDGSKGTGTLASNNPGRSRLGWHWLMGRQALLLVGPDVIANTSGIAGPITTSSITGVLYNDGIAGIGVSLPPAEQTMYMGLCDVSRWLLESTATEPGIIRADPTHPTYLLEDTQTTAQYRTFAYGLTYGIERLRCNPFPPPALEAWQVAQSHPIFMSNVSDFIVEFAADTNNDGEIDMDTNRNGWPDDGLGPDPPAIVWYGSTDAFGNIVVPDGSNLLGDSGGAAFDYSAPFALASDDRNPFDSSSTMPNANIAYVWRHDFPDNWPHLIRIRYRAHDLRGDLTTTAYNPDPNGDGNLFDGTDESIAGKWFEVIIPVPRP